MNSHRLYIDSIASIVDASTILCPHCQSFICDGMEVDVQWEIVFVSWNGVNMRHRVLIEGQSESTWHMVRCNPLLRRQEQECCRNIHVPRDWQNETSMLPKQVVRLYDTNNPPI